MPAETNSMVGPGRQSALLTDLYELTMAAAYLENEFNPVAVFELFIRSLPAQRGYLISAGLEQALDFLENAGFARDEIEFLRRHPVFRHVDDRFFRYLEGFRFHGEVWAIPEGTPVFAGEPLLRVTAPIMEAQIVETFLLSTLTYQTLIASKAARVVEAAAGRGVVEFGTRRGHGPQSGVLAARAAYLGGCVGTSNVQAGYRFGIPTFATLAHSFVLANGDEEEAFRRFQRVFPEDAVLLVDTYDTLAAIEKIIELGLRPRAVRLDSGDLVELSTRVRQRLDQAGLHETRIFASGDLNEYIIQEILARGAPLDSFGVGTELTTSADAPALAGVYKLVELAPGPARHYVAKFSQHKGNFPGRKQVFRFRDSAGQYDHDLLARADENYPETEALLVCVMREGRRTALSTRLAEVRQGAARKLAELPLERLTTSDSTGFYVMPELPIGQYSVTVEKQGFQKATASGIRVDVAAERRVDVTLRPGQVEQVTEVRADIPLVETTNNVLGGSFQAEEVLDLPVNGRDFTKLLIMVPGAAGEPNGGGDSPGSFGLFSVNGNRGRSNNFLLDGTDMNDGYRNLPAINQGGVFGTPGTVLPIEAIAELRVLSNFEPEYGRNSGSVVNIVTKSGTNTLHGSVFEYFRHDKLNSRNFFNSIGPKNKFRNHQFGASVGGPIATDKTFFYGAYEGQRERLGIDSLNQVPTLEDFANAFGAIRGLVGPAPECAMGAIFNCVTAQPMGVVNPVVLNLFNLCNSNGGCSGGNDVWPAANLPGTPNSVSTAAAFNDADSFIIKLDHNFDQNNLLSGRYFFGNSNQSFPLGLAGGNNLPGTNTVSPIRAQLVSISFVHLFSPTLVSETRFGWNRYSQDFLAEDAAVFGNPNDTIGLNNGVTLERDFGLPTMRFGDGFAALGSSGFSNPRGRSDTNWHFIDNFSWKVARHDVKLGYEFRRTTVDSFNDFHFRGRVSFGELRDFLEGAPTGFSFIPSGNTDRQARQNSHALYIQDSIRIGKSLTVGLGLRWDYFGIIGEELDRFSNYDPSLGLVQVGQLYERDVNNFSPRVSFAWNLGGRGKTVLRGGWGLAYDIFSQDFFTGQIPFNSFNAGPAYNAIGPDPVFFSFTADAVLTPGDRSSTPGPSPPTPPTPSPSTRTSARPTCTTTTSTWSVSCLRTRLCKWGTSDRPAASSSGSATSISPARLRSTPPTWRACASISCPETFPRR